MKLLLDENLSPALVARFYFRVRFMFTNAGSSPDTVIWDFAAKNGFTILSKDLDFYDRSMLGEAPPKVIWLRTGNCATQQVEQLLRSHAPALEHFSTDPSNSVLVLP